MTKASGDPDIKVITQRLRETVQRSSSEQDLHVGMELILREPNGLQSKVIVNFMRNVSWRDR